jgi:23S rRNA pseudouridine1911/1915/1917 synthase
VVVTIFSATGFSIREKCHDWVQIAIDETMKGSLPNLTIGEEEVRPFVGRRLDVCLASILQRSRTQVQALLKEGLVHLQPAAAKVQASYRLRAGDSLTVDPDSVVPTVADPSGEDIPLEIIFEDDVLIALNKQPGLVVHPAAGHWTGTLVNALIHHCGSQLAGRGGQERLGIVHRLDKDTSGLMLIAKTDVVHERLSTAFAQREVKKIYRALCRGVFRRASGELRGPIGRHPVQRKKMAVSKNPERSKSAWTDFRVLQQGKSGAEVECLLHTGRTHQIRVHLSHLGHPIFGDELYGGSAPVAANGVYPARQMLHAARIEIAHPMTGKLLQLEAPLPQDYIAFRAQLSMPRGAVSPK